MDYGALARRFRKSEEGGVLPENVMWFAFMFLLSVPCWDIGLVFMSHATVTELVQSATRSLVVGELHNCAEVTAVLDAILQPNIASATATCDITGSITSVSVTMTAQELGLGVISPFLGEVSVSANGMQTLEYVPTPSSGPPLVDMG